MPESSQFSGPHGRSGTRFNADERATPCSKDNYHVTQLDSEERASSEIEEHQFRKSYCSFLRDVGLKLRMPHVVVATATVYCHRFFAHQSREKNDQYMIATACIFLSGKVEEARRALEEVVFVSYCLQNKLTSLTFEEFKKKDVCDRQKELVLLAEHFVLVNLDFNLEVKHPYSFILTAAPKYKPASEILSGVSLIILNDVLYTTLYLQFKPQHIAAGALLLAAKLVKYKFPSKDWWKEFGVKMHQLEEICNQILELYEQERGPFSVVQSSSSSSSIDARAKGLFTHAGSKLGPPQPNILDGSQNSHALQNSCLTKSTHSRSQNPLRLPLTCVPATGVKRGS